MTTFLSALQFVTGDFARTILIVAIRRGIPLENMTKYRRDLFSLAIYRKRILWCLKNKQKRTTDDWQNPTHVKAQGLVEFEAVMNLEVFQSIHGLKWKSEIEKVKIRVIWEEQDRNLYSGTCTNVTTILLHKGDVLINNKTQEKKKKCMRAQLKGGYPNPTSKFTLLEKKEFKSQM